MDGASADGERLHGAVDEVDHRLRLGDVDRVAARHLLDRGAGPLRHGALGLWGVDYADAARQVGALDEVEAAISVLRRQGESGRPVAELVGSGHSNQETAAELFMSVKTVETNLTRIYRKLSVRSRSELAHRLNTLELTDL